MDIIEHLRIKGWKKVSYTFPENQDIFPPINDVEPERLFSINVFNELEILEETDDKIICNGYQQLMAPFGEEGIEILRNKDIELKIIIEQSKI